MAFAFISPRWLTSITTAGRLMSNMQVIIQHPFGWWKCAWTAYVVGPPEEQWHHMSCRWADAVSSQWKPIWITITYTRTASEPTLPIPKLNIKHFYWNIYLQQTSNEKYKSPSGKDKFELKKTLMFEISLHLLNEYKISFKPFFWFLATQKTWETLTNYKKQRHASCKVRRNSMNREISELALQLLQQLEMLYFSNYVMSWNNVAAEAKYAFANRHANGRRCFRASRIQL